MASITTRNSRKSRSIGPSALDNIQTEGLSHSAIKLHSRKMKPTSRVVPAREQYSDEMKDDHPNTKLHDTPQPKRFNETMPREYGAIKISHEIAGVKQALDQMGNMVQKRRKEVLDERDKATDAALKGPEFSFTKKDEELSPKALKAVRKIIREELDATSFDGGSGIGSALGAVAGALMGNRGIPGTGGTKGNAPSKAPTGPTIVPNNAPTTTVPGSSSKAPTGPKAVVARPAFDRSARLGRIAAATARKKGIGAAVSKTAGLLTGRAGGAAGSAMSSVGSAIGKAGVPLLGTALYAGQTYYEKKKLDELKENGAISEKEHQDEVRKLMLKKVLGGIGMLGGAIGGAAISGGLASVGGGMAGGLAGEKLADILYEKFSQKPEPTTEAWKAFRQQNDRMGVKIVEPSARKEKPKVGEPGSPVVLPTFPKPDLSKPIPTETVAALERVSQDFSIPMDEMVGTAERESSLNAKAKNPQPGQTATGLYQHTEGTWNALVEKFPEVAKNYDIKKVSHFRDDRKDPFKSAVMFAVLRKDNASMLGKLTTGDTSTDNYLMHLMGIGGAKRFIKEYLANPNQLVTQIGLNMNQIEQNPGIFGSGANIKTLAEVVQTIKSGTIRKTKEGYKRIEKTKAFQAAKASVSLHKNPESTGAAESVAKESMPKKISETPARISQTEESTRVMQENKKQAAAPMIVPMQMPMVPQAAPAPQQQNPVGANLVTRNDNPYLVGTKLQEIMRQK